MAELPSGTVTFLFTDIEGSTTRWEQWPEAMQRALARHDTLVRAAIVEHGGHIVKTMGDAFHAAFRDAREAVAAALDGQRRLQAEPWDQIGGLRVRMALHTGATEERDGDYYGPPMNRVARLLSVGHGGQILLSEATAALTRDDLPPQAMLEDLGAHRLKDLTRPERVFQLTVPDLPADFPPLVSLDHRPHNLPIQPTPLIGREHDIRAVHNLLTRDDIRLVTVTGPGGAGKTRLSLQVAAEVIDRFMDGVFFVALAPITNPELVPVTIAQALDIRDVGGRPVLDILKDFLRKRQLLLLLDNFEQILLAAPVVSELLSASLELKILVTSRAPLELRGEHELPVPPLAFPNPQRLPRLDTLSQYGAVALFIERATAIRPDFTVTNDNAPAVAEICQRLDGLPLAIELAAARIRLLSPQTILARLERRLPLLTGGARDLPARQQTLRGTIAWSHDLLEPGEQQLFRRLAVFVGGFTLEAAETVCGSDGDLGIDVLDGLESLVIKNLVRREDGAAGESRFGMLETICEYGLDQLTQAGELQELRRWHAGYFLDLAEQAVPRLRGAEQRAWQNRLEAEHDNLRAVLEWSLADPDEDDVALRLAGALAWFWTSGGHTTEGRRWLKQALARPAGTPAARLKAHYGAGWLAHVQRDPTDAQGQLEAALALAQALDDAWANAWALHLLGRVAYFGGDAATASALGERSLVAAHEARDDWLIAWALHLLGLAAHIAADYHTARVRYEEALAIRQRLGFQEGIGICQHLLAMIAYREGDHAAALALTRNSVFALREVRAYWTIHNSLAVFATLAAALRQPQRAVRLAGATAAFGESVNVLPIPLAEEMLVEALAAAHRELGDADYATAWVEGRAMTLEQAITYALDEVNLS